MEVPPIYPTWIGYAHSAYIGGSGVIANPDWHVPRQYTGLAHWSEIAYYAHDWSQCN